MIILGLAVEVALLLLAQAAAALMLRGWRNEHSASESLRCGVRAV